MRIGFFVRFGGWWDGAGEVVGKAGWECKTEGKKDEMLVGMDALFMLENGDVILLNGNINSICWVGGPFERATVHG